MRPATVLAGDESELATPLSAARAPEAPDAVRERTARRFEQVERELGRAIEVGALTREAADGRLAQVREALDEEVREAERLFAAHEGHVAEAAELERRLAAGELTRAQVEEALAASRKRLGLPGPAEEPGDGPDAGTEPLGPDELEAERRRLQRAVVDGELTRREMLEALERLEHSPSDE